MKRNSDEMDTASDEMITEESLPTPKKLKDMEPSQSTDLQAMDFKDEPSESEQMLLSLFRKFVGSPEHSFVERESNPLGHSLTNSNYVGKKTYRELSELEANVANASQFVAANMGNRVDQIGRQMKYLHGSLEEVFKNALRDSELHMAACNFVKKAGQTYHLYIRPSGQKYFSMLSPVDWQGNPPHKFLGSWYLESDQSWTPAEERHLRFEGVTFLKNILMSKSIQ